MTLGAEYLGNNSCRFRLWAPKCAQVDLSIESGEKRRVHMQKEKYGYWTVQLQQIPPGTDYYFVLDNQKKRPDPASHFQPYGVHGPSQVVDHASFTWQDRRWSPFALKEMIFYELHPGTFTQEGTLEAIIPRLRDLQEVGINALNIMPVAQFPGERNWGYDGVHPFAVQNSYGGPEALKKLVNVCHKQNMAVFLDVVYNHLGPEGNYLKDFAPYFTHKYQTPWGPAVNFDSPYSDEVREFFIQNAIFWCQNYHLDGLRLDAVHAIFDMSAKPFLQELSEKVQEFANRNNKVFYLIAESELNDSRLLRSRQSGGFGLHAQWNDDFHHALHSLLTGEDQGYYQDFGRTEHLIKSLHNGYTYTWNYSPYRIRRHGNSTHGCKPRQFVVFSQNHDQIGNRMLGERLSQLVSFEALKLAAAAVILSPFLPLLFMGEEYGEDKPFLYFVSHTDPELIEAVRQGRKSEFEAFHWHKEPPDPQDQETFLACKLDWDKRSQDRHKSLLAFYRRLIHMRKEIPALSNLDWDCVESWSNQKEKVIYLWRWEGKNQTFSLLNFHNRPVSIDSCLPSGYWRKALDSSDSIWAGPGTTLPDNAQGQSKFNLNPSSIVLYQQGYSNRGE